MNKIKIMDNILANKIAAGEVVEKTMNVVKELVENSIDAESDEITVRLIDAGVKEISVADNGVGMSKEDAITAFERHATSKLTDVEDLFNIESLGFRGEALPSIASVSKITLKTSDGIEGTTVTMDGLKDQTITKSNLQKGTTIIVKDLFYNTPVRLKYLKNLYIELAYITEYINKMALSFPNIKFTLYNNDKCLLQTDGSGNLLKVIYEIYGVDITKKMTEIAASDNDYYISGYISYPEVYKSNRNAITTFVNGRIIKNNDLNKQIIEAYHTYIPKDKFPIIIINIDVDPILIDINIHPTKMDIKFSKMQGLKELINQTIAKELKTLNLIPKATIRTQEAIEEVEEITKVKRYQSIYDSSIEEKVDKPTYEEVILDFEVNEDPTLPKEEFNMKSMIPRGIVHLTYLVAENEEGMFIIDQHAAAERINYEKYLNELRNPNKLTCDLLIPIKIETTNQEYLKLKENINLLNEFDINIEEFGINTFIIRSHPAWLPKDYEEQSLKKIIELVIENETFSIEKFIEKTAITLSCRLSIKANDYINYEEQVYLIENLRKCKNPFTCPHGRPTVITHTKYDLEKMFKRALD